MHDKLIDIIYLTNPWLLNSELNIIEEEGYITRQQEAELVELEWDKLCTVLVGPRQAGKTTLGYKLCQNLIKLEGRFDSLLYLNCDYREIREFLSSVLFIQTAQKIFKLKKPIIFIDEAQRLESPGLLLKSIIDLKLPIKIIASGSSQLEFKSKIQEYLTGRQVEYLILPLSYLEYPKDSQQIIYGSYPGVIESKQKEVLLSELYRNYIQKDIIEILKVGKADVMERLITLMAHASGQLVNYQKLSIDLKVSVTTVQHYLSILENTYVIKKIVPFVGNKRKEITSNPIYYFIDNGFRNQALNNFSDLYSRQDMGLIVEGYIFQELYKYETQMRQKLNIKYWRTQSGAEVDFVLAKDNHYPLPIEVKFTHFNQPKITRSYRSFLSAYQPRSGIIITRDFNAIEFFEGVEIHFISIHRIHKLFECIESAWV